MATADDTPDLEKLRALRDASARGERNDNAFIAASRTAVPWLLDRVAEMERAFELHRQAVITAGNADVEKRCALYAEEHDRQCAASQGRIEALERELAEWTDWAKLVGEISAEQVGRGTSVEQANRRAFHVAEERDELRVELADDKPAREGGRDAGRTGARSDRPQRRGRPLPLLEREDDRRRVLALRMPIGGGRRGGLACLHA